MSSLSRREWAAALIGAAIAKVVPSKPPLTYQGIPIVPVNSLRGAHG